MFSSSTTAPSPAHARKLSAEGGLQRLQTSSNTFSRYNVHFNGNSNDEGDRKDLMLYDSQAASFPVVPQLWPAPQPLIPYYFSSPPPAPQYSTFSPYMSCSCAAVDQQQEHSSRKTKKECRTDFWCAGIAQLLWTIIVIVMLGLVATLILALTVV